MPSVAISIYVNLKFVYYMNTNRPRNHHIKTYNNGICNV